MATFCVNFKDVIADHKVTINGKKTTIYDYLAKKHKNFEQILHEKNPGLSPMNSFRAQCAKCNYDIKKCFIFDYDNTTDAINGIKGKVTEEDIENFFDLVILENKGHIYTGNEWYNYIINFANRSNSRIIKDKNFDVNHKRSIRSIDDEGRPHDDKIDYSVSELTHLGSTSSVPKSSSQAGLEFDKLIRDFFIFCNNDFSSNNVNTSLDSFFLKNRNRYKLLNKDEKNIQYIKDAIKSFVAQIKIDIGLKNSKNIKIITDEFHMAATINNTGSELDGHSVAGSPDIVVVAPNGDLYIYDVKTIGLNRQDVENRKNGYLSIWNKRIEDYNTQVSFYKNLVESNDGSLVGKVKKVGFFPVGIVYDTTKDDSVKSGSINVVEYIPSLSRLQDTTNPIQSILSLLNIKKSIKSSNAIEGVLTQEDINDLEEFYGNENNSTTEEQEEPVEPIETVEEQKQLLGPETKINIYAGANENAYLSNFAERPFTSESPLTGNDVTYKTVEGAFQAAKLGYTNLSAEEIADIETNLMKATGSQARSIGRRIKGLNSGEWDKNSSRIMKALLKASFEQNPQALQRLLDTGNATLTHTQDKGKWGTEFPKLLMEVRDELRKEALTSQDDTQEEGFENIYSEQEGDNNSELDNVEFDNSPLTSSEKIKIAQNTVKTMIALAQAFCDNDYLKNKIFISDVFGFSEENYNEIVYRLGFNKIKSATKALKQKNLFDFVFTLAVRYGSFNILDEKKYNWLTDNNNARFNQILFLANNIFSDVLGITLKRGFEKNKKVQNVNKDSNIRVESSDDTTSLAENEEELDHERYDTDKRTIPLKDTIQAELKRKLSTIVRTKYVNIDGVNTLVVDNKDDDNAFSTIEFVPIEEVLAFVIQRYSHVDNSEMLLNELQKDQKDILDTSKNIPAYLEQIIEILKNDPLLRTQAVTAIRKVITNYGHVVVDENGKVVNEPLINSNKVYNCLNDMTSRLLSGRDFDPNSNTNHKKLPQIFKSIQGSLNFKLNKSITAELDSLRGYDLNYTLLNCFGLTDYFYDTSYLDFSKLNLLYKNIKKACDDNRSISVYTDIFRDSKHQYTVYSLLKGFFNDNVNYIKDKTEQTVYDGESYTTYNQPSFIEDLLNDLNGKNQKTRQQLKEKYGKYRAYVTKVSNNKLKSHNTILQYVFDENISDEDFEEIRKFFVHKVNTTTSGHKFSKQSLREKTLTLLANYFLTDQSGFTKESSDRQIHFFRVPVMSDKPADESYSCFGVSQNDDIFKKITLKKHKNQLIKKTGTDKTDAELSKLYVAGQHVFDYFKYELDRMRYVLDQFLYLNDDSIVSTFKVKCSSELRNKLLNYKSLSQTEKNKVKKSFFEELFNKSKGLSFVYCDFFNKTALNDKNVQDYIFSYLFDNDAKKTGIKQTKIEDRFICNFVDNLEKDVSYFTKNAVYELDSIQKSMSSLDLYKHEDSIDLRIFLADDYLASCNIINLSIVDPAYYKDTIDLQKRFAQVHSSTIKPDLTAKFVDENGEEHLISDGMHRTVIIQDLSKKNMLKDEIDKILDKKIKELEEDKYNKSVNLAVASRNGVVDIESAKKQAKINNFKTQNQIDAIKFVKSTIGKEIEEVTDGQSYAGPTAFWKKLTMLGVDTTDLQEALKKIRKGEYNVGDLLFATQQLKSFLYHPVDKINKIKESTFGDEYIPFQVKHSEAMILLASTIIQGDKTSPLAALFDFMEDSAYKDKENKKLSNYKNNGIDCISFASTVKSGKYSVVNLNGLDYSEAYNELTRCCYSRKSSYNDNLDDNYVKRVPFSAWGKQQEVPAHCQDHEQQMGSQIRVLSVSDLSSKEFDRKKYFDLINKDLAYGIQKIKTTLNLQGNRKQQNITLRNLMLESLKKNGSYTVEAERALSIDSNGNFKLSTNDPFIQDLLFKTIFSLMKKNINYEQMFGGPVVQVSPYGFSDKLKIVDSNGIAYGERGFDPTNGGITYQIMTTAPSREIELAITFDSSKHSKFDGSEKYKDGDIIRMKDIKNWVLLTKDQLEQLNCIAYRIPTEDKYSIFRCEIVDFLPRQAGEAIIMPPEVTVLSGCDFDIDKMYIEYKFDLSDIEDKLDKNIKKNRNNIFDMQWEALGTKTAVENHLNPGNFEILKNLAKKVSGEKLNSSSIFSTSTQTKLYKLNDAGKNFVGIAALNNIAHSLSSIAEVMFNLQSSKLSDKQTALWNDGLDFCINIDGLNVKLSDCYKDGSVLSDPTYSPFDGSRISRTIGMFVGAAADNAKEAVLGALNITPTTANVVMSMLRLGVPLKLVVAIMTDPLVVELSKSAESNDRRFEKEIEEYIKTSKIELTEDLSSHPIGYKETTKTEKSEGSLVLDDVDSSVIITFLHKMAYISDGYNNINTITKLNSAKNSVGPNQYKTYAQKMQIDYALDDGSDLFIPSNDVSKLLYSVPYLKTFKECFDKNLVTLIGDKSLLLSDEFSAVVNMAIKTQIINPKYVNDDQIKQLYEQYVLYKAYKTGFLDSNRLDRAKLYYKFPVDFMKLKPHLSNNELVRYLDVSQYSAKNNTAFGVRYQQPYSLTKDYKGELSAAWLDLLRNEKTRGFSQVIFKYFLSQFGVKGNINNLLNIAPVSVRISFGDEYNNIYSETSKADPTIGLDISIFFDYFCANRKNLYVLPSSKYVNFNSMKNGDYIYYRDGKNVKKATNVNGKIDIVTMDQVGTNQQLEYSANTTGNMEPESIITEAAIDNQISAIKSITDSFVAPDNEDEVDQYNEDEYDEDQLKIESDAINEISGIINNNKSKNKKTKISDKKLESIVMKYISNVYNVEQSKEEAVKKLLDNIIAQIKEKLPEIC